jgi:hypothetical protein
LLSTPSSRARHVLYRRQTALAATALLLLLPAGTFPQDRQGPGAAPGPVPGATASPETGTGFEGRVVIGGQVLPGARVFAYRSFEDFLALRPLAASAITADDGAWRIDAPPGRYFLAAKKLAAGAADGPVRAGDYSAYHGSNPITAVPGKYTHVGFAMEKLESDVAYEESGRSGSSSIAGIVTSGGQPLDGVSVSVYADAAGEFRGLGIATLPPTGKAGAFRVDNLPAADYFVIVRKRASGKNVGPIGDGDFFGFFGGNPVRTQPGKTALIRVAAVAKASEIGKDDSLFRDTGTQVAGRVIDRDGRAVPGVYAFAYEEKEMSLKRPAAISRGADAEGRYVLNLPHGGTFYLGARSDYGDTPRPGEWYGRYAGTADHAVAIEAGSSRAGIDITVERIPQ